MKREGVTAMWPWFPAILQPLLDQPDFIAATEKVRAMLLIGPEALVDRIQKLLPNAEIKIGRAALGKEWVGTCSSRWSPSHYKKKQYNTTIVNTTIRH